MRKIWLILAIGCGLKDVPRDDTSSEDDEYLGDVDIDGGPGDSDADTDTDTDDGGDSGGDADSDGDGDGDADTDTDANTDTDTDVDINDAGGSNAAQAPSFCSPESTQMSLSGWRPRMDGLGTTVLADPAPSHSRTRSGSEAGPQAE